MTGNREVWIPIFPEGGEPSEESDLVSKTKGNGLGVETFVRYFKRINGINVHCSQRTTLFVTLSVLTVDEMKFFLDVRHFWTLDIYGRRNRVGNINE